MARRNTNVKETENTFVNKGLLNTKIPTGGWWWPAAIIHNPLGGSYVCQELVYASHHGQYITLFKKAPLIVWNLMSAEIDTMADTVHATRFDNVIYCSGCGMHRCTQMNTGRKS